MIQEIGGFAVSLAGHDRGRLYVITGGQEGVFLLADGKIKTLENPKKKKRKHLQLIHAQDDSLRALFLQGKPVRNEDIKRAIKLYQAKVPTK